MIWVYLSILVLLIFAGIKYVMFIKHRDYLDIWNKDFYKSYDDPRKQIIAHGLLASSGHNTQPWKFVLSDDQTFFDMYIERCHLTSEVDPDRRQLFISQGTFLKNIKIASEVLGYDLDITYDFIEDWNIYQRLAKITLKKTNSKRHKLYDYLFKPDTHRGIYKEMTLSDEAKKQMKAIAASYGLDIKIFETSNDVKYIGNLALEGAFIEARNQDVMNETCRLFKNNETSKRTNPYGFSLEGQGLSAFMIWFIQILMRFFPSFNHPDQTKKAFLNGTHKAIAHTYTYLMITCDDLDPKTLIEVGMLYQELILNLHDLGLVIQPLSQAIEVYDDMKPVYEKIHKAYGQEKNIVMLARVGYPEKPFNHSMRFKPEQVIEEV